MKRVVTIAAVLFMVVTAVGSVSAEMINAGPVKMEKAELERIQGLMSGNQRLAASTPAAAKQVAVDAGPVKMNAADMAALQDYVSGRTELQSAPASETGEKMDNAGPVRIPASDFDGIKEQFSQGHAKRLALLKK